MVAIISGAVGSGSNSSVAWAYLRPLHIFGALAEFERNLIRERTQAGLQAARARGRKGGRPKSLDADKQVLAVQLYAEKKHTVKRICQMMGISKPTLYEYIAAHRVALNSKP